MTATEITRTGYSKKISSDQLLINLCILRDACHELFCICGDFYASGTQDTEVTKPLCYTVFKVHPYKILSDINLFPGAFSFCRAN